MKLAITVAAAMILTASVPAQAYYDDGNTLLSECSSSGYEQLSCMGYIEGVSDALDLQRASNSRGQCVPVGVTGAQLQAVLIRYLKAHPENLHQDASYMTVMALGEAWNCKDKP